ncbi:carbon-nitrogen hydrolase [Anaeromyces robustus]|uniref:Carbon-nitrogen hydrolase n=1 Tax=Anaeromyces robustus TaxID=1754192 RepID=A0A1Y1XK94_9FUNG|nr:carbon-nitrogen hydrolase [Anaeromyces robustus]|eukprot:ORX85876.1 carbon-nitrogen hydrolase [Anaeromyces robustus]
MKIGIVQFAPIPRNREKNIEIAEHLTERLKEGDVDYIIFPEMIFTGYMFESKEEVKDFVEDGETGVTVTWAKNFAKRINTFVQIGYPQVKIENGKELYYNSICIVNPKGEVKNYQKSFLYSQDEKWAEEGKGFQTFNFPELGVYNKVGPGICMDINPYRFEADFEEFEFANFHLEKGTTFIPCSMAWLSSGSENDLINYWLTRFSPLILKKNTEDYQPIVIAISNRSGTEKDTKFAGGSCVLKIEGFKNLSLLGILKETQEGMIVVDTEE